MENIRVAEDSCVGSGRQDARPPRQAGRPTLQTGGDFKMRLVLNPRSARSPLAGRAPSRGVLSRNQQLKKHFNHGWTRMNTDEGGYGGAESWHTLVWRENPTDGWFYPCESVSIRGYTRFTSASFRHVSQVFLQTIHAGLTTSSRHLAGWRHENKIHLLAARRSVHRDRRIHVHPQPRRQRHDGIQI